MRIVWRALVVVAVFVGVGLTTANAVVKHAVNAGNAESQVRLAGAMAGLLRPNSHLRIQIFVFEISNVNL